MLKNNRIINVKSVGRRAHGRPKIGRRRPISPTDFPPIFPPESLPQPGRPKIGRLLRDQRVLSRESDPSIDGRLKIGRGARFLSDAPDRTPGARLPPEP